jgi:hypothetical protein
MPTFEEIVMSLELKENMNPNCNRHHNEEALVFKFQKVLQQRQGELHGGFNCIVSNNHAKSFEGLGNSSGLYKLTTHVSNVELNLVENLEEVFLWRKRLGHLSFQNVFHLKIRNIAIGLSELPLVSSTCECCQLGKQHKEQFPRNNENCASQILEFIHIDLCGTLKHSF